MEIIKIVNENLSNNFLVAEKNTAILVDCAVDVNTLKKLLGKTRLVAIVLTHGHFDHFSTIESVVKEFKVKVYMHKNCYEKLTSVNLNASLLFNMNIVQNLDEEDCIFVENEEEINIENFNLSFYYAFGHTDDSILVKINQNMFVGDFIFKNGIGRTDLPTGDFKTFKKYFKTIKPMLKNVNLFYGHDY